MFDPIGHHFSAEHEADDLDRAQDHLEPWVGCLRDGDDHHRRVEQDQDESLGDIRARQLEELLLVEFLEHEALYLGEVVQDEHRQQRLVVRVERDGEGRHVHEVDA